MTDAPAQTPSQTPPTGEVDHLAALKKMSTTAGLGSGDYAAVSPLAVAAIIVSLLGTLSYFSEFLLVAPAAGVVLGWLGLRQIRQSNGTITGREWAFAGIGIGAAVIVVIGGLRVLASVQSRPDREAIAATLDGFDKAIAAGNADAAYDLTSPTFKSKIDPTTFRNQLDFLNKNPDFGRLSGAKWNGKVEFLNPQQTEGQRAAVVGVDLKYENRPGTYFIALTLTPQPDGKWYINHAGDLFPEPKKARN
jgi:hypothetical protein